jgi:hypothetical protein
MMTVTGMSRKDRNDMSAVEGLADAGKTSGRWDACSVESLADSQIVAESGARSAAGSRRAQATDHRHVLVESRAATDLPVSTLDHAARFGNLIWLRARRAGRGMQGSA